MTAVAETARLCGQLAIRLPHMTGTALARLLGKKHPLGWPLDQELLVLLLYGLLEDGHVPTWRRFFTIVTPPSAASAGLQLEQVQAGACPSWWLRLLPDQRPKEPRATVTMMYLHGGAFVAGHARMYTPIFRYWLRHLAAQGVSCEVLAVDYPLAPEHPFPQGLLAAVTAYEWLEQQTSHSHTLVIGGDSAGGNLALGVLQQRRHKGSPQRCPHAALLISPAVDLSDGSVFQQQQQAAEGSTTKATVAEAFTAKAAAAETSAARQPVTRASSAKAPVAKASTARQPVTVASSAKAVAAEAGPGCYDYLPKEALCNNIHNYIQEHMSTHEPLISPTYISNFSNLVGPGGLVVVAGGAEVMQPDIQAFAGKAATAGACRVVYHNEPDEPHCYCCLDLPRLKAKSKPVLDLLVTAVMHQE